MIVLRHDHVSQHHPTITLPHLLQNSQEQVAAPRTAKQSRPTIATEGDEVQIVSAVPVLQAPRHAPKLDTGVADFCDAEHSGRVTDGHGSGSRNRETRGTLPWVTSMD